MDADKQRALKAIFDFDNDGITFVRLLDQIFDKTDKSHWKKLRSILTDFIDEDLVEERHMLDGKVDYVPEKKGEKEIESLLRGKLN